MSSQVTGVAVVPMGTIVGVAMVPIIVGTVVIAGITYAVVWTGQKLEENYRNAIQQFNQAEQQAIDKQLMNRHDFQCAVEAAIQQQLAQQSAQLGQNAEVNRDDVKNLLEHIDSLFQENNYDEIEKARLQGELQRILSLSRGIVSDSEIAFAEQALSGTSDLLRLAIAKLQIAWERSRYDSMQKQEWIAAAQNLLRDTEQKIMIIAAMTEQNSPEFAELNAIKNSLQALEAQIQTAPDTAYEQILTSFHKTQNIEAAIITAQMQTEQQKRSVLFESLGKLQFLRELLNQPEQPGIVQFALSSRYTEKINVLEQQTQDIITNKSTANPTNIASQIDLLKDAIFHDLETHQQEITAEVVIDALKDIEGMEQIKTEKVGSKIFVQAQDTLPNMESPGKVSIQISQNGELSFEMHDFIGEHCVHVGEQLFEGLKKRGLFVIDPTITNIPNTTQLTNEQYLQWLQEQKAPEIVITLPQAALHEHAMQALQDMGLQIIQERQYIDSVSGEIITEIDASKAGMGFTYSVKIDEQSSTNIAKNGVSVPDDDPIKVQIQQQANTQQNRSQRRNKKQSDAYMQSDIHETTNQ